MTTGYIEIEIALLENADPCETFCENCGQLRLWLRPEAPERCGHCGSAAIIIGKLGSEGMLKRRDEWRKRVGNSATEDKV